MDESGAQSEGGAVASLSWVENWKLQLNDLLIFKIGYGDEIYGHSN